MVWENLINTIKDRFTQLSSEQKRLLVIVTTVVFSAILTAAVIFQLAANSGKKEDRQQQQQQLTINVPISSQELFLPDEPDFLPGVLLDRERRGEWTEEDIMEFWQDPLRAGEEQWRDKIDTAVNELLERVP